MRTYCLCRKRRHRKGAAIDNLSTGSEPAGTPPAPMAVAFGTLSRRQFPPAFASCPPILPLKHDGVSGPRCRHAGTGVRHPGRRMALRYANGPAGGSVGGSTGLGPHQGNPPTALSSRRRTSERRKPEHPTQKWSQYGPPAGAAWRGAAAFAENATDPRKWCNFDGISRACGTFGAQQSRLGGSGRSHTSTVPAQASYSPGSGRLRCRRRSIPAEPPIWRQP